MNSLNVRNIDSDSLSDLGKSYKILENELMECEDSSDGIDLANLGWGLFRTRQRKSKDKEEKLCQRWNTENKCIDDLESRYNKIVTHNALVLSVPIMYGNDNTLLLIPGVVSVSALLPSTQLGGVRG
ncbi:hypothetical protein Tco_0647676 [Tanacetum coccineum]